MIRDRWTRMNKFRKRVFAVALATAVGSTTLNVGSIAANAGTSARGRVIVAFEDLPEDVAVQTLPVGAKKSDINFPEELEVLLYNDDIEKTEKKDKKKTKKKKTVTVTEEVTEEATEVVKKVVKKQVTKKSDDQEEDQEEDQDAVTDEGASQQAGTEGGSTDGTTQNPGTNTEDTGNTAGGGNDTGSSDDSSTGNDGAGDSGSGSDDTGSGNDGGSEDSGSGSDSSEGSESSGGSARVGVAGLVSTAAKGAVQAFVPVKAYAAEAGEGEEDRIDRTVSVSENTSVSSQDTEKKDEKTDKGSENKDEDKSDTSEDKDSKSKDKSGSKSGNSENRADSDDDDDGSGSLERLSEGEPRTLEDVQWKLDRERSEYGGRFQTVREGDVFFFVPNIRQYGLKSEVDLPTIKVTIVEAEDSVSEDSVSGDSISDNSVSGNTVSENASPEFDQFMIVGGVKVSVTAPEGVFPEGAVLKVKQIDDAASNEKIEQAVKEDMGLSDGAEVNGVKPDEADSEDGSSAPAGESLRYISFDITITDVSGNEIQPDTEHGKANVTFSQADIVADYIAAPGEETEGKLGDGTESEEGSSDVKETTSKAGGRTYILGGDEDEDKESVDKKTLRVYHFDDDFENMDKLDASIDEADKAVAVDAEHFSPYTVSIGTDQTSSSGVFGDFKISSTGARVEVTVDGDTPTDPAITEVQLNVIPAVASEPDIKISLNGKSSTSQKLKLTGGIAGNASRISLNNITMNGAASVSVEGFHGIDLSLTNYNADTTALNGALSIDNSTGKIRLNGVNIKDINPFIMDHGAEIDCYVGSGTNIFEQPVTGHFSSNMNNQSTLSFYSEEGVDGTLEFKGNSYMVFSGSSGKNVMNFESGNYVFHSYRFAHGSTNHTDEINIKGGSITATAVTQAPPTSTASDYYYMNITGGTHKVSAQFLGVAEAGTSTIANSYLRVTGGSFFVSNSKKTDITDSETTVGSKYLHVLQIKDSSGAVLANTPVVKLYKNGTEISYGLNDSRTDSEGKLYVWMHDVSPNVIYSVETKDGTKYVWDDISVISSSADSFIHKYAARTGSPDYNSYYVTSFVPYDYITDIELDNDKLLIGANSLKDCLTFKTKNGKTYTGSSVIGANIAGLYDRLMDIEWSLSTGATASITNNKSFDAKINLPDMNTCVLTASIPVSDGGIGTARTWKFYIPNYVGLNDMTLNATEAPVGTPGLFKTADRKALGIDYTLNPTNPTAIATSNKTFSWKITDPFGTVTTVADNTSYTPNAVGEYKLEATLPEGKSETEAFKKTFTVTCKKNIAYADVLFSPHSLQYTGSAVKPTVTVKDGDTVLKEGTDYELEFHNNVDRGSYAAGDPPTGPYFYVKGKGYYTGQKGPFGLTIGDLPHGKITVGGKVYDSFQTTDAVGLCVKESITATLDGKNADNTDPTKAILLSQTFYPSEADVPSTGWTDPGNSVTISAAGRYYVYGKLTDANNNTVYLSTQRIVFDTTKPRVVSINKADVVGTQGNVTVQAEDETGGSGIGKYYVLALQRGATPPSTTQAVKNNPNVVTSESATVTIPGLSASQKYTFYVAVEDKAGNLSEENPVVNRNSVVGSGKITAEIRVEDHKYDKLQGKQEIDDYYKEPKEIKITATAENGVKAIEYFITDKYYSSASAIDAAAKDTKGSGNAAFQTSAWAEYKDNARPYLLRNKLNYIYVRVTDNGGGKEYFSSKGIWEDEIKPTTSSTKTTPKDTSSEVTVKGTDKESGVKNYYLLARKDGETAPAKAEDVKSAGQKSEDGKFNLTGLTANTKYTLYAVTEDKAGNLSEIKKGTLTTKKTADAAKKDAAKKDAAKNGGAGGSGSGSGGKNGTGGSNISKRTAGAGSGDVSGNEAGDELRDGVPYIEDASDGILIGREETSGWDRIMGEVGKASAPAQVFVNMNGSTVVPSDALDEVKDRDVTYYFDMNEDVMWAVNGLSFTADPSNVDFRVRLDTKNIPSKLVNEIADVYPHKNLTLEYDGEFGFTAILSLYLGEENEGMYANLYFYNEDNNSLEFVESTEIDGSGKATFNFLHASDYTVIIRGDALTEKTAAEIATGGGRSIDRTSGGTPANVPKTTGHLWLIIVSIISFLLCGLILFLPDKKRRRRVAGAPV